MKKKIFLIIFIILFLLCLAIFYNDYIHSNQGLSIKSLGNIQLENGIVSAKLETNFLILPRKLWCISTASETAPSFDSSWTEIKNSECMLKIDSTDNYIYIRDSKNVSDRFVISNFISCIADINVKSNSLKLINDEHKDLGITLTSIGSPDETLTIVSQDEAIAKIENNEVIGIADGKTKILISDNYGNSETIDVQVTSLLSLPVINNSKPYISNMQYTEEEAHLLDDYLFYQIDEAGYKTRAGVVAAARFLSLEFKYRIPYFVENGRITHFNHQRPYCDGEGRYYHRGLYLSKDKFADIEKSVAGPAMWGAYIREWSEDNGIIRNGLDCSGFVCWCLINGGFDFGDIGGGLSEGLPTLSDRGVSHRITMDYLEQRTVKAGDLIGYDGHIGIIIGVEDGYVSVADTLFHSKGLIATRFSYKGLVNSYFTHIYDYTDEYVEEGNYTEMW